MAYGITEPCIGVKDASCLDVCPVDCIYSTDADTMYFIHPDECIDCGACESVCPVSAIFPEDAVPDKWKSYTEMNKVYAAYFPGGNFPARTTVVVSALPHPDFLLEIECEAVLE